jgi:RNA polymerase sigma-70 factor (ECF subfamily)
VRAGRLRRGALPSTRGRGPSFQRLYDDLAPPVAAYLRGRGARDVEDVTSEVFLAVFTGLGRFTGGQSDFRSWVFTIAHRRLVDQWRANGRTPESIAWEDKRDPRSAASAEEDALVQLGEDRVRQLLAGLSEDQRDVLLLRILGDLTVDQVAEALGKRSGAVKALQRRRSRVPAPSSRVGGRNPCVPFCADDVDMGNKRGDPPAQGILDRRPRGSSGVIAACERRGRLSPDAQRRAGGPAARRPAVGSAALARRRTSPRLGLTHRARRRRRRRVAASLPWAAGDANRRRRRRGRVLLRPPSRFKRGGGRAARGPGRGRLPALRPRAGPAPKALPAGAEPGP